MAKLSKRGVDALEPLPEGQSFLWDSELRGFGVRVLPSGLKTFVLQYRNQKGETRRIRLGRYGVLTTEMARDMARVKLGMLASGEDPDEIARQAKNAMSVGELCDWYILEARAGRILGRRGRPLKTSSLDMDESRIRVHIKPLLGKRIAAKLTIGDVEAMQSSILQGKTATARRPGRGGKTTGGPGAAARSLATLQAVLGHAKHKGMLADHPTRGAKKLATKRRTRRLSTPEIISLGKALSVAEQNGENPVALAVVRTLLLTGYRREEAQAMQRAWIHADRGYVSFPDTKGGMQMRGIGKRALDVLHAQRAIEGNPYVFPSASTDGPFTAVKSCLARVCHLAGITGITPHTLRHTFGSMAGELGFSELTIRAMLGHASQNVTQGYVHIDEAVKLAIDRTSDEIAGLLGTGVGQAD
ncbi:site-specific integrase [Sandaracinobacter neustonicus]|uniref:Site-specific integrase n=1 Tax=Sandaracinobacter neustonicus TaxID=1715348 RepID=A0A501XWK3_9SPHN|nr:site-specific integrase [Sandaracinobacter neustonicus]TPE64849.1 site-specific integrase [Sandaracinobacter neustonicus]